MIKYNVKEVHTALVHPCSPVRQGKTSGKSLENFETYIWQIICGACDVDQHCVQGDVTPTGYDYVKNMFHRLPEDTFFNIKKKLEQTFIISGSPVCQWSLARVCAPQSPTRNYFQDHRRCREWQGHSGKSSYVYGRFPFHHSLMTTRPPCICKTFEIMN